QDWVQCTDLFISGSLHEGMPLAPLEAAGSGLPLLLTEIEGHRFLKPWAYYFDPAKPEEGARQIMQVMEILEQDGELKFFGKIWDASSSLRERWGANTMTASYSE